MSLIKYKPFSTSLLDSDLDRVFENFFDLDPWDIKTRYPKVDVRDEKDHYIVEADLPGLTEKDIEVKVENDILTIQSNKTEKREEKKNGYLIRERKASSFIRSFVLPNDVNREQIEASMKNGVLTIKLSKNPEAKPKMIEIKKE